MDTTPQTPAPAIDENQIIAERRGKLAALRARGTAFPNDFRRDTLAADLHARYDAKSNEDQCVRLVSQQSAMYGTATFVPYQMLL